MISNKNATFCKKYNENYYILYIIGFLCVVLLVFGIFFIKGTSLVLAADGYNQVLPTLAYIKKYIINFLENGYALPTYDWEIGYGENALYSLSWTGFGNPLSALIVLFPTNLLAVGYSCITLIKLYLIGLSCSIYLKQRGYDNYIVLAMALSYAFSVYVLLRAINYPVFLDAMITFPLIIGGVEDNINKERMSIRLIIGTFFQSLCGFYFLYIELLLAGIYYIVLVLQNTKSFSCFVKNGIKCMVSVVLGMGMGSGVLFPSIVGFLSCSRRTGNVLNTLSVVDFSNIGTYIKGLFIPDVRTMYTIPFLSLLLLIKTMKNQSKSREKKVFLLIMILGIFIPLFGSFMNGLSNVENERWSFAIHFFICVLVAEELQNSSIEGIKENKIYYFLFASVLIVSQIINCNNYSTNIIVCGGYAFFVFALGMICLNRANKKILSGVIIINVIINGILIMYPDELGGLNENSKYLSYEKIEQRLEKEFSVQLGIEERNNDYRIDIIDNNLNIALYSGQAGCTEYLSVLNKNLYDYYDAYGLLPVAGTAHHLLNGLDNRAILEDVFSVKYYNDINKNSILENENYCDLGLVYNKQYTKQRFEQMSMLERMSALTQGVVLEKKVLKDEEDVFWTEHIVPYKVQCSNDVYIIDSSHYSVQGGSSIILELAEHNYSCEEYEMYLHIKQAKVVDGTSDNKTPKIEVNGKEVLVAGEEYPYYTGKSEVWLNTPINSNNIIEIRFNDSGNYILDEIEVYFYNIREQEHYIKQLVEENRFENITIDRDIINGFVREGEDKVLVLSIPYEKGWKVYINNQRTSCIEANNGLLAVPLQAGANQITLEYVTPYRNVYIFLSVLCWGIFLSYILVYLRNNKDECVE